MNKSHNVEANFKKRKKSKSLEMDVKLIPREEAHFAVTASHYIRDQ